ncbi:MAG TPA: hypothetical protein VMI34_10145 [Candidatus Bathyarchaeia archaeon]|nr:hypothetical protein [Candidatus Bathyarchaeia archaeon]
MNLRVVGGMLGAGWLFLAASGGAAPIEKHAGVVTAIDARQITISEMGPWRGPETKPVNHTFRLTPATKIVRVERTPEGSQGWPWSYASRPLGLSDLLPGDYVTVTAEPDGRRGVAVEVEAVALDQSR